MPSSAISHERRATLGAIVGVVAITALSLLPARGTEAAAEDTRMDLARALAAIMLDDGARRALDEQVTGSLIRAIGATLQDRLNRRLLDVEWQIVSDIVKGFLAENPPSSRADSIAAGVYARHFDEAELRELLRFQQSLVGKKVVRLGPVIRMETADGLDAELRESPAVPRMIDRLQREFPVLRTPQSP